MTDGFESALLPPRADRASPTLPAYRWSALPPGQRAGILIGWSVLGLVETIRVIGNPAALQVPSIPWDYAVVGNFPWWFAWAILTPLVFRTADWLRPNPDQGRWRLLLHLPAAGAIIALHLPMALFFWFFTNPLPQVRLQGFGPAIANAAGGYLLMELLAYAAAVGLFHAIENHRRLTFREIQTARFAARAAELETAASEARLEALRMELNPHFLFNALNGVGGLIRLRELTAASRMLSRLGDLLRVSLSLDRSPLIPLERELANLELYLDIERQRFRDRLTVSYSIAAETQPLLVPVLCLQPLVENAIRHGVSAVPGPASIRIAAVVADGFLVITVSDDGPGFPAGPSRPAGIGLANTRARLAQLYGDEGSLTLGPGGARGAAVSLRIPIARALAPVPPAVGAA